MRRLFLIISILIALPMLVAIYGFAESRRMPLVREANIGLPGWPNGAAPIRVALLSDIHIGNASTDRARLDLIVTHVNALRPDLVLIAGDFVYGHDPAMASKVEADLGAALSQLHPPLGTVAVFGNHDIWTGADHVRAALERAGITLLRNQAVRRGPVAIAGVDDPFTGHQDVAGTWARVSRLDGAPIVLSHSPDIDHDLPHAASLLLAGHSHCGQVRIPWYGAVVAVTRDRESCGLMHEGRLRLVVTGGLGTSGIPLRLNAPPDLWLLRLGPVQ